MQKRKRYKARSIAGAEQRVRQLERIVQDYEATVGRYRHELTLRPTETEKDLRIQVLEAKLTKVREALRGLVPELFRIHPDDLVV